MTTEEAIKQLEFDRAMILFNATTGEEITPEILKLINGDNYRTYVADGVAIEALKEIQQYRAIGTVEECRKAVEKQKAKKPEAIDQDFDYYKCPVCGEYIWATDNINDHKYCLNCGQAIQREESLEGMEDE